MPINSILLPLPKGHMHAAYVGDGSVREVCEYYLPKNRMWCRWDSFIGGEQIHILVEINPSDFDNVLPIQRDIAVRYFEDRKSNGMA